MIPKPSDIEIKASSAVTHPVLERSPWTVNGSNNFIFHTRTTDLKPEVVIRFSEDLLLTQKWVYLHNRYGDKEIAAMLLGVQFGISDDGISWRALDISLTPEQIYQGHGIPVQLTKNTRYLRLFRDKQGPPIHLSQITIGIALQEKREIDRKLTRQFAEAYQLPLDCQGYILEHKKAPLQRQSYSTVRSSFLNARDVKVSNVAALEIRRLGRFSNALIQICNAFCIAKKLQVNKISLPNNPRAKTMFPDGSPVRFEESNIELFFSEPNPDITVLEGIFLYSGQHRLFSEGCPDHYEVIQDFKHGLGFDYSAKNAFPEDEVVIHIRSGDIFQEQPHPGYGQPPLAYYRKIIDCFAPNMVYLVYEDESNPVIGELKTFLTEKSIHWTAQSASLRKDIEVLLKAKTLVAGRGSFVPGIVALSESVRTVYTFHQGLQRIQNPIVNEIVVEDRAGEYVNAILKGNWSNSQEQRKLMLEYPDSALKIRGENPRERS